MPNDVSENGSTMDSIGWGLSPHLAALLQQHLGVSPADLGPESPHDEVVAQIEEVRAELQPLIELLASFVTSEKTDLAGFSRVSLAVSEFKNDLLLVYGREALRGVLSLAVLDHPSDLETIINPPPTRDGEPGESPAVFTHVDFKDPRHKILGPDGLAARVVRQNKERAQVDALYTAILTAYTQFGLKAPYERWCAHVEKTRAVLGSCNAYVAYHLLSGGTPTSDSTEFDLPRPHHILGEGGFMEGLISEFAEHPVFALLLQEGA